MPSEPLLGALRPAWTASPRVGALMSSRSGGVSAAPWDSLNLGTAVGDDPAHVAENRRRFIAATGAEPCWLQQVHGRTVLRAAPQVPGAPLPQADASWTDEPGIACIVQLADCMPVLLAAPEGRAVAAAHAGWRGLAGGVVEAALRAVCEAAGCEPAELQVWLGPCIGPRQFEVGADVLQAFGADAGQPALRCFVPRAAADGTPRWLADLQGLAEDRLAAAGVRRLSAERACTVEQASRFFSYRRDGRTGRMAAAVWIRG